MSNCSLASGDSNAYDQMAMISFSGQEREMANTAKEIIDHMMRIGLETKQCFAFDNLYGT